MVTAHSLAASIRAAQESETLDLSGLTASSIEVAMEAAFGTPLVGLSHMIRFTFITGAGKQARQKYDDGAAKAVTGILLQYGYVEDRGAGCDLSSAGTFKTQHDTGKNIKTVVVFPKIVTAGAQNGHDSNNNNEAVGSILPENSPGYKIAVCSMSVFRNMVNSNCTSWSQKKGCLTCIEGIKELVQDLDAKLILGTSLDEAEQKFYNDVTQLEEKEALVKELAHDQVEHGAITSHEKQQLLQQNAERMAALSKDGKSTTKLVERRTMLESVQPMEAPHHKLKHHAKIAKLYKELKPLLLVDTKGGRLLSIKESAAVTRKEEILQEIERLEDASREWFEDDDTFALRVAACRREFQTQTGGGKSKSRQVLSYAVAAGGGSSGTAAANSNSGKAVNKWLTPMAKGKGPGGSVKKKSKPNKSGLFGAMIAESSDEEEEREESSTQPEASSSLNKESERPTASTGKKKPARKKKKGNKSTNDKEEDDNEVLDRLARENEAAEKEAKQEEGDPTAFTRFLVFMQTYILPLLVAIIGWIIGVLFRRDTKPKRKRG